MKRTFTKLLGALLCALFLAPSSVGATITATWDFAGNSPSGIETINITNETGLYEVPSDVSGVSMWLTGARFLAHSNQYLEIKQGSSIRIPVVSTNDVVTLNKNYHSLSYTLGGESGVASHKATEAEVGVGYVVLDIPEQGVTSSNYLNSISVKLAYKPVSTITATWDWKNDTPSGIQSLPAIQNNTGNIASNVTGISLFVNAPTTDQKLAYNSGASSAQCNNGTIIQVPVNSTSDIVTITSFPNYHYYTIAGNAATADLTSYKASDEDVAQKYVEIIATSTAYIYSITLEKHATATIGATGWATYSNNLPTDFTNLVGVVDAYQVTGNTGTAINKSSVTTAAANTGLLVNAEAGTYAIPLVSTGTDLSGTNKLKAVSSSTAVGAAPSGYTNFVLVGGSGTASFKKITGTNSATVGAGKAYLQLEGIAFAPQLFFDFNDATAINAVESKTLEKGAFYNLAGQRVENPTKGLYIVNGKKVVLK